MRISLSLTPVQQELLDYICGYTHEHGMAPTIREMMVAMDLSSPAPIQYRLEQLKNKGCVVWKPGAARTVRVLNLSPSRIAVQGTIQGMTGEVTLALTCLSEARIAPKSPTSFALEVNGAIPALGIQDRDRLIFRPLGNKPVEKPMRAIFKDGDRLVLGQIQLANSSTLDIQPIRDYLPIPAGVVQAIAVGMWRDWESA